MAVEISKVRKPHPLISTIERVLAPGTFIAYGRSWDFMHSLHEVKDRLGAMVKTGQAREAIELYDMFLAGCYDKAGKSKYYHFALEHLRTAKRLYGKLGEHAE